MKNKSFEALVIIILSGLLLVGFSFLVKQVNVPFFNGRTLKITFINKDNFFDFSIKNQNSSADSLINKYTEDSVRITSNGNLLNKQIAKMTSDSLKIREIVNYKLNCFLSTDTAKNEKAIQKFIKNYLSEEANKKKKIIKEELLAYLNLKNIKNEFLVNPEKDGVKALDKFFEYLMKHKETDIVRIAHYGDSQLEGDRVTSSLRNKLHARFGGLGLGFVPMIDNTDNVNLSRTHSLNWKRYTIFHDRFYNGFYGIAGVVFRFGSAVNNISEEETLSDSSKTSENKDENKKDTGKGKENEVIYGDRAFVNFKLADYVRYSQISLMYGRSKSPCKINVYCGGEKIISDELPETNTFRIFKLNVPANTLQFKLEFIASVSPDFYGLLIDGNHGVQIDNYALRGHSGDGLMLINSEYYALQIKELNTRLIILQYGANVVPYIRSEKMCKWLEESYVNTLTKLRNAAPNTSILVIGVGDMARKSEGESGSYPILPKIRDAQKNAAMRTNCAFWDLFESMGGINSIITWAQKHLASRDGHLSNKGREIMAKEIFDALMIEYDFFRYNPHKKKA